MSKGTVNRVTLVGRLGQDPEVRDVNDKKVANFSLATSERNGDTTWHRVSVWGKPAEFVGQFLKKGSHVYLEGRIQHRSYKDKDGNERTAYGIVAHTVQSLNKVEDTSSQEEI